MVLKRADFGKFKKSSQTPWNVSYVLENGFLTVLELIRKDFERIPKGLKSTDFLTKKSGLQPMVLKRADFSKRDKSSETSWNVSYVLANGFLTVLELIRKQFERIPKRLKSTDFDKNAWAIAHGFEEGRFQ